MCGQTVTFPAIPPGGRAGPSLRVRGLEAKPERTWPWKMPAALVFLRDFRHWKVVAQCAVPFLILGGLLAGAAYVKEKLGGPSAGNATPAVQAVQADPEAWQKMTDLNKADQAVRDRMKELAAAHAYLALTEQAGRKTQTCDPLQRKGAENEAQRAQKTVEAARQRFDAALARYQKLGGTVDYHSQLRDY